MPLSPKQRVIYALMFVVTVLLIVLMVANFIRGLR